jgi:hypothetical protein
MPNLGYFTAGSVVGFEAFRPSAGRRIGPFANYVMFEESHQDDLEITDHPIEQGAQVSDHAYKRPHELTMKIGWSDSGERKEVILAGVLDGFDALVSTSSLPQSSQLGRGVSQVAAIYDKLLTLQGARLPFDVYTGKRVYKDMLVKSLSTQTDNTSEHTLPITVVLRQVIRVSTTTLLFRSAPPSSQMRPDITSPITDTGSRQPGNTQLANTGAAALVLSPGGNLQ